MRWIETAGWGIETATVQKKKPGASMSFLQKFVEKFESDVFISYSSLDDEALFGNKVGWVTDLHTDLQGRLRQLLSPQLKVWRDDQQLAANDELTSTLVEQLAKSGVLLTVVSPPYLDSKWCKSEFELFCEEAKRTVGPGLSYRRRILRVVKTPVSRDQQPTDMRDLVSIDFYEEKIRGGKKATHEYGRDYPDPRKYREKLDDLAHDIKNFLEEMSGQLRAMMPRTCVYLAQVSPEMKDIRQEVRRDLMARGFEVVPETPIAPQENGFRQTAERLMQRSPISIHLLGEQYGEVPKGETESHDAIEAALAAERCSDPNFRRLIWMPVGLKPSDPRQQKLIEFLENDNSVAQRSTDLLQTKIEDFKTTVHDRLAEAAKRQSAPKQDSPAPAQRRLRVYIVADAQDLACGAVQPLEDLLFNLEFDLLEQPGGDEVTMRQLHADNLELCDACVIFSGQASPQWLQLKLNDLRRAETSRPGRPLVKAIYMGGPVTEQKSRFRTHEATVIKNFDAFSAEKLSPLLDELRKVRL